MNKCVVQLDARTGVFLALGQGRQEDKKYKVFLGYTVSLGLAWAVQDPVLKANKEALDKWVYAPSSNAGCLVKKS